MIMNKKAMETSTFFLSLAIGVVVIVIALYLIGMPTVPFIKQTKSDLENLDLAGCKNRGSLNFNDVPPPDCTGDGLPDKCDPCIDGDSSIDTDSDGMPDECEIEGFRKDKPENKEVKCMYKLKDSDKTICSVGPKPGTELYCPRQTPNKLVVKADTTFEEISRCTNEPYTLKESDCPAKNFAYSELEFEMQKFEEKKQTK